MYVACLPMSQDARCEVSQVGFVPPLPDASSPPTAWDSYANQGGFRVHQVNPPGNWKLRLAIAEVCLRRLETSDMVGFAW